MNHANYRRRFAALGVFGIVWELTEDIANRCEQMATGDPDSGVRVMAVTCLWSYYKRKNNLRIGTLLAGIVTNENETPEVREAAYHGLFYLRSVLPKKLPPPHVVVPQGIDWRFVRTFLY